MLSSHLLHHYLTIAGLFTEGLLSTESWLHHYLPISYLHCLLERPQLPWPHFREGSLSPWRSAKPVSRLNNTSGAANRTSACTAVKLVTSSPAVQLKPGLTSSGGSTGEPNHWTVPQIAPSLSCPLTAGRGFTYPGYIHGLRGRCLTQQKWTDKAA